MPSLMFVRIAECAAGLRADDRQKGGEGDAKLRRGLPGGERMHRK
jgi:hypothetical protein